MFTMNNEMLQHLIKEALQEDIGNLGGGIWEKTTFLDITVFRMTLYCAE